MLFEQAQIIGNRLAREIARMMATHAVSDDPDVFICMHQYRVFIFVSDAPGIGHAVARNLETDWG